MKIFIQRTSVTILCAISVGFFFAGCCSTANCDREGGEDSSETASVIPEKPVSSRNTIPPGHCHITGTLVDIDTTRISDNPDDPCFRFPCNATMIIETVHGYGPAFSTPLAAGKKIPLYFVYSIAGTAATGFTMEKHDLAALQTGSRIETYVKGVRLKGRENIEYHVYSYSVVSE